jgi:hypothetical protein
MQSAYWCSCVLLQLQRPGREKARSAASVVSIQERCQDCSRSVCASALLLRGAVLCWTVWFVTSCFCCCCRFNLGNNNPFGDGREELASVGYK